MAVFLLKEMKKNLEIKEIYPQLTGIALQPHSNLTIGLLKRVINLNDDWGVNVVHCNTVTFARIGICLFTMYIPVEMLEKDNQETGSM